MGIILDVLGIVVALAILAIVGMFLRRRLLASGGTFDCSLRLNRDRRDGRGWLLGIARYSGDTVEWFRVFSLGFRPRTTFNRRTIVVRSRRSPDPDEALMLYADHVIIECVSQGKVIELAMTEDALTGFLAWIESSPPGRTQARLGGV